MDDMNKNKDILLYVLACILCAIILGRDAINFMNGSHKQDMIVWIFLHLLILMMVVCSSLFAYNKKILILLVSVVWFGSTIIQQLIDRSAENYRADCWTDAFIGNIKTKFDKTNSSETISNITYTVTYLTVLILLMIICLYKFEKGSQLFAWLGKDRMRTAFIIMLPVIAVFINEGLAKWLPIGGEGKQIISEDLFSRFITGQYNYDKPGETQGVIMKSVLTISFLFMMFILFINYTSSGTIAMFDEYIGTGESDMPIYIALFILLFFNFIVRGLFLQKCSLQEETRGLDKQTDLGCRIGKYGGLSALLYISYVVLIVYQVNGMRDRMFALLFIAALTFGFSELFIRLKKVKK